MLSLPFSCFDEILKKYYVRDTFADFYFFKGIKPRGYDWLSSSFCIWLGLSAFFRILFRILFFSDKYVYLTCTLPISALFPFSLWQLYSRFEISCSFSFQWSWIIEHSLWIFMIPPNKICEEKKICWIYFILTKLYL